MARLGQAVVESLPRNILNRSEPKKIIVNESIYTGLLRCWVHIPPVLTSIIILYINIHGLYLGINIPGPIKSETINLLLLQVLAKIHELMIVASLGLIILHIVRHELLFGEGLPLGLIGSGISFSNIGFFFKAEFYGSLRYLGYQGKWLKKIRFIIILIVCGVTAAFASPASAVLLLPKSDVWPGGGTEFLMNGSASQIWPLDLASDISELQQFCSINNSSTLSICPAGGFTSLREYWGRMNYTNFHDQSVRPYAKDLTGSHFYRTISSPGSQIPPIYALGDYREDNNLLSTTFSVQPHAGIAAVMDRITTDWWGALISKRRLNPLDIDDRQVTSQTRNSIAAVRCSVPANISASEKSVQFPTIVGRFFYSQHSAFDVETLNGTAVDHLRFQWVHLPSRFGAASIGAVLESPWTTDQSSRLVIGCTAQAGWVPAKVITDAYSFWSGWYPWAISFPDRTPAWTQADEGDPSDPTNGRIALGTDWLDLLTPPVPSTGPGPVTWEASTIESILDNAGFDDGFLPSSATTLTDRWLSTDVSGQGKTSFLEVIVCSVLADGISRSASYRLFNTTGPLENWSLAFYDPLPSFNSSVLSGRPAFRTPAAPSTELSKLKLKMSVTGLAVELSVAGYLSMSVLLIHMALVSMHVSWVIFDKRTSRSWNSISELIALSQNSTPAFKALANTGGGITRSNTFARVAKIRARSVTSGVDADHVELVFEEHSDVQHEKSKSDDQRETLLGHAKPRSSSTWPLATTPLNGTLGVTRDSCQSTSANRGVSADGLPNNGKSCLVRVNKAYH